MSEFLIGIALFAIYIYWNYLESRPTKPESRSASDSPQAQTFAPAIIGEEAIIRRERQFEDHFGSNLPDAPPPDELQIYQNLMRPWFHELAARHRYQDDLIAKLRTDWYDYMEAVDEKNTSFWLSFQVAGAESREHVRQGQQAAWKAAAIDDAFAQAIGPIAVQYLAQHRIGAERIQS